MKEALKKADELHEFEIEKFVEVIKTSHAKNTRYRETLEFLKREVNGLVFRTAEKTDADQYKCDCDPEVGFFCAHCANENNYIQDLQNQIVALKAENARYREALLKINIMIDDINSILYHIAREALKGE